MRITAITGRQILDSRGNPTVEADVILEGGFTGRAAVPSGASTGKREAVELRDGGKAYGGLGVSRALGHITGEIAQALKGLDASNQEKLDQTLIRLDGTKNKARLGANSILAVSLAAAKAAAKAQNQQLYEHIGKLAGNTTFTLPRPMMNIINGGKHAAGSTDIQEFMIVPIGLDSFAAQLQAGTEVFHALGKLLKQRGYATTVGDEGGFAPAVKAGNSEALELIIQAITNAGYEPGKDITLALDVAASELVKKGGYYFPREDQLFSTHELITWYDKLTKTFPITSIEDGLGEDDWSGWEDLTRKLGRKIQLVGDDLYVTNTKLLRRGIDHAASNAILIKPNQIGTLTETIEAVKLAQANDWGVIISHRSGETEDTTIAHLAVGLNAGQIKTGSLSRSERTAKYNELLRISPDLS